MGKELMPNQKTTTELEEQLQVEKEIEEKGIHLKFLYEEDEKTGHSKNTGLALSDGTTFANLTYESLKKYREVCKKTAGTENMDNCMDLVKFIAWGMSSNSNENRVSKVAEMLPMLRPQNETETLLLGQFLALQDSALECLRQGNYSSQDSFYHLERLFLLSSKLFAQANATMQTLMKFRSGGKQTVQVVHFHNEGQAIVANNLSHSSHMGSKKKSQTDPMEEE